MQNIVIPVISPAVSALTPALADNSIAPTEPFGNVLARQLADNAQLSEINTSETGLPITSTNDDILTAAVSNEEPTEPQAPAPVGVSSLPTDMLAALMPYNIAAQISISSTQPTQTESVPNNRAQSITTSKGPLEPLGNDVPAISKTTLEHDTPATELEMFNTGLSSKSMAMQAESQLTPQSSTQVSAPQPNASALVTLPLQASNVANHNIPIQLTVNMPLANNAWADEFSQKIVWVATQHGQSAELHLNPPQLGPLDVLIKVNGDQATALFTSPHAVVRDAIEQALPKLREMLADNGIMLGNTTVSDQSPREQQTKQTDQPHKREGWQTKMDQANLVGGTQVKSGRHHQGLVDTFA
jgi:flagellar hook-length control protein FliK